MNARDWAAGLRLQAAACLFGVTLLALLLLTGALWPDGLGLSRYDFLFVAAVGMQVALWAGGLEARDEAIAICVFHVAGMTMEIVKTAYGSWAYPEASVLKIGHVPLFTGFMYAAVGSYLARSWRLHNASVTPLAPAWARGVLAACIYVNFFAWHLGAYDFRAILFVAVALVYRPTMVVFDWGSRRVQWPLLGVFALAGALVWAAENIGTLAGAWIYPNQTEGWSPVTPSKFGSWFLLMIVSFELVAAIRRR